MDCNCHGEAHNGFFACLQDMGADIWGHHDAHAPAAHLSALQVSTGASCSPAKVWQIWKNCSSYSARSLMLQPPYKLLICMPSEMPQLLQAQHLGQGLT